MNVDRDTLILTLLNGLTAETRRLQDFFETTGLAPGGLSASSADGSLAAALFHYALGNEDLLIASAAALDCTPEVIAATLCKLDGSSDFDGSP